MTNRTPYIEPAQQAEYNKSSFTNQPAGVAPEAAPKAKPAAKKPAAKKKPAKKPASK